MEPVLLADIGGTNSRFAVAGADGRPERVVSIENDAAADLEFAIARYIRGAGLRPRAAVLAVAAPVTGEEVTLTNRSWRFHQSALAARFGFAQLLVVNDFEAIASALPLLSGADSHPLGGPPEEAREGARLALGPGTGLGVAAIVPADGRWQVVPSEGGHASFGPAEEDETEVFARLRAACGHVSAETVLSGPGLTRLAQALDPLAPPRSPEAIVADARAGEPSGLAAARLFVRLLGRFAGGLALTFRAVGGVYVAGGVAQGLGPLLAEPHFRAAFEAHPPYEQLLATIPTRLLTCAEPGLLGCAALAQELSD